MKWLWLEDKKDAILPFIEALRKNKIEPIVFTTAHSFMHELYRIYKEGSIEEYGLILDLRLPGNDYLKIPRVFFNKQPPKAKIASCQPGGHDVGLVLYENLFQTMKIDKREYSPVIKPMPVVFFTVSFLEFMDYNVRFEEIKNLYCEKWHTELPRVRFLNKFERPEKLLDVIHNL